MRIPIWANGYGLEVNGEDYWAAELRYDFLGYYHDDLVRISLDWTAHSYIDGVDWIGYYVGIERLFVSPAVCR